ncbi:MAG: type II toxin-antitoxin system prevent-host-death family antitoxin [Pseudomonadota bacterium]|nr:type II toxin-antitoxin system prevent-host-death family antitoxin [Pseudomonadota bacterium]
MIVADLLIDRPAIYDHNWRKSMPNGFTMQVSIRELKAHLSQYLSRARAGQSFEVTSHRKIVARIIGVPASDSGLSRLLASGAATWAGGKPAGASLRLRAKGTPVSQMVMEDRG